MIKNISRLECLVKDKAYQLTCDMDSPLSDVKEALFQFQKHIGQLEDHIRTQQEAANAKVESLPVEEAKAE